MSLDLIVWFGALGGLVWYFFSGVLLVQEGELAAIFRAGRFVGFRRPGLRIVVPGVDRAVNLRLGERGQMVNEVTARFSDVAVPIV